MLHKKGISGINEITGTVVLVFVLALFMYVFLGLGIAQSRDITLEPKEQYTSSAPLITLLKTPTQDENKILATALVKSAKAGIVDPQTELRILSVLGELPKEDVTDEFYLVVRIDEKESYLTRLGFRNEPFPNKPIKNKQEVRFPGENPEEKIVIGLYLTEETILETAERVIA